ncbi:L-lactate dehydrogenase complex protein LldG [Granulicella rosea]|uniref:L-lactate dehydrogenase complex protein LldG n=1 Tax=Granulicella rosea TaxID=474952 RepID=A0A239IKS7_9BACT|nr:LUD domain-containing protein [Granulicella rosea]SNS93653.1 L-lactate dehydrogenase complex protein LldG [Granulicella rosea]
MATDARTAILSKIRSALGTKATPEAAAAAWAGLPRDYVRVSTGTKSELIERLIDRLHDYDAQVLEVEATDLKAGVAKMLTARGATKMLIPLGLSNALLPEGVDFTVDTGLSAAELDACGGVLTEATLAIAETGSLVLQNVAGQGRRAGSLVPDYHLCVVDVAKVVGTVPEAISALQATAGLATTFISGPSATADIEMTRIKGVHGPRFLDVILVH